MKVCYERNGFTVFVMCFVLEPVRHWPVVVISPFRVLHLRSTEVSCINMKSGFRSGGKLLLHQSTLLLVCTRFPSNSLCDAFFK